MTSNPIKNINNSLATNVSSNSIHQRGLSALATIEKPLTVAEKLYQEGLLYEENEEYEKAFHCFDAAADLEHGPALYSLAQCYESGDGVEENLEKFKKLLIEACDLRDVRALKSASFYYEFGLRGFQRDLKKAFQYIKTAAEIESMYIFDLANCYIEGIGVDADINMAISCLNNALSLGHLDAMRRMSDLLFGFDNQKAFSLLNQYQNEGQMTDAEELFVTNFKLAICYLYAVGTVLDIDKAKSLIQQSSFYYESCRGYLDQDILLFLKLNQIPLIDLFEKIEQLGFKFTIKMSGLTYLFGVFSDNYNPEEITTYRKRGIKIVQENKTEFSENNYECLDELYSSVHVEDKGIAKQFLILALDLGIVNAQLRLADCYKDGVLFDKDLNKAAYWYETAAEQGNAEAQNKIGDCFYHGDGVAQDYKKAVYWFEKAAKQGYARAQINLGICFNNGNGVTQDYKKAVYWYEKTAEQGYARAQNSLGDCYYYGQGTTQDYLKAVYWYRKAAEQELEDAFYNLGHCYENALGVDERPEVAAKYYRKGAEEGHVYAQYELGLCYANGYGVDEDMLQCAFWIKKAADQGYEDAVQYLAELNDSLG